MGLHNTSWYYRHFRSSCKWTLSSNFVGLAEQPDYSSTFNQGTHFSSRKVLLFSRAYCCESEEVQLPDRSPPSRVADVTARFPQSIKRKIYGQDTWKIDANLFRRKFSCYFIHSLSRSFIPSLRRCLMMSTICPLFAQSCRCYSED